jgi:hypothetical protein
VSVSTEKKKISDCLAKNRKILRKKKKALSTFSRKEGTQGSAIMTFPPPSDRENLL